MTVLSDAADIGAIDASSGTFSLKSFVYSANKRIQGYVACDTTGAAITQTSVAISDPTTPANKAAVQLLHNTDAQVFTGSYGLLTGGVGLILNGAGTYDRQRSASGDGQASIGILASSNSLWNGTSFDRQRTVSGDGVTATGVPLEAPALFNGATYDRARGVNGMALTLAFGDPRISDGAGNLVTPVSVPIVASAAGSTVVVAAQAGKRIRVLSLSLACAAATGVQFLDGATALTGSYPFGANGGIAEPHNPAGLFTGTAATALNINLSAAAAVGGRLTYVLV